MTGAVRQDGVTEVGASTRFTTAPSALRPADVLG